MKSVEWGIQWIWQNLHVNIRLTIIYHCLFNTGLWGSGACPSCHWSRGEVHLGQVASSSQCWETETTTTYRVFRVTDGYNLHIWFDSLSSQHLKLAQSCHSVRMQHPSSFALFKGNEAALLQEDSLWASSQKSRYILCHHKLQKFYWYHVIIL